MTKTIDNATALAVIKQLNFKMYNDDFYYLKDNKWINLSFEFKNQANRAIAMEALINETYHKILPYKLSVADITKLTRLVKQNIILHNNITDNQINRMDIVFLNGYFNKDGWHPGEVKFSPFQIPYEYNPNAKKTDLMGRFIDAVQPVKEQRELMLKVLATTLAPYNWSIMPIFYSAHSTSGKGTMVDMVTKIISIGNAGKVDGNQWLGKSGSRFALSNINKKTMVFMDELPTTLDKSASDIIKNYVDTKDYVLIENKGIDSIEIINTHTYIVNTNNRIEFFNIDDSLKKRVIWLPFDLNSGSETSMFTAEEIREMIDSKQHLDYLLWLMMEQYKVLLSAPGKRNEKFLLQERNMSIWEAESIIEEAMEQCEVLSTFITAKEEFIPSKDIQGIADITFPKFEGKKALRIFKNELVKYISNNKLGIVENGRKRILGKEQRGLKIKWTE